MLTISCDGKVGVIARVLNLLLRDKARSAAVQVSRQRECTGLTAILSTTRQGVDACELTSVTCLISITTSVGSTAACRSVGQWEFGNILASLTTLTRHWTAHCSHILHKPTALTRLISFACHEVSWILELVSFTLFHLADCAAAILIIQAKKRAVRKSSQRTWARNVTSIFASRALVRPRWAVASDLKEQIPWLEMNKAIPTWMLQGYLLNFSNFGMCWCFLFLAKTWRDALCQANAVECNKNGAREHLHKVSQINQRIKPERQRLNDFWTLGVSPSTAKQTSHAYPTT